MDKDNAMLLGCYRFIFLRDLEIAVEYWRVRVPLSLSVGLVAQFWNVDPLPRNESRTRGAKNCFGGLYLL